MSGRIGRARTGSSFGRESHARDVILNRQRTVRIPRRQLEDFVARARQALRLSPGALTIALVTNTEIARWNRTYRHKAGPTDVLSFPAGATDKSARGLARRSTPRGSSAKSPRKPGIADSEVPLYLGDIAIAPSVARRNAHRFGRTFSQEMRILILHGMLHLMGYDHEMDTGQMERRERRLRQRLGLG